MRLIARMPDQQQVGALLDSLKNIGIDRSDIIVSDMADEKEFSNVEEATDKGISMIETERNSLNDTGTFAEGIEGLKGETGIVVAVKTSKRDSSKIREIMEESGAVEIIQD